MHRFVDASGSDDIVNFAESITADEVYFERAGNDLIARVTGSDDGVVVADWFANPDNRIEEFRTADGQVLDAAGVEQIVEEATSAQPDLDVLAALAAAHWHMA